MALFGQHTHEELLLRAGILRAGIAPCTRPGLLCPPCSVLRIGPRLILLQLRLTNRVPQLLYVAEGYEHCTCRLVSSPPLKAPQVINQYIDQSSSLLALASAMPLADT